MVHLKAICHVRRIDQSGLKDVLVIRLKDYDDKVHKAVMENKLFEVLNDIINNKEIVSLNNVAETIRAPNITVRSTNSNSQQPKRKYNRVAARPIPIAATETVQATNTQTNQTVNRLAPKQGSNKTKRRKF